LDLLGSIEKLQGHKVAGLVIVKNETRALLVAFYDLAIAENNRKSIGLFVVDDFHGLLQYLAILLVLYAVTTWYVRASSLTITRKSM
jgi:hypothetical protein